MSSELVKALKAWDAYEPNISEEKVLMQAVAVIDAARPLLARIEALEAESARLREALEPFSKESKIWAGYDDAEVLCEGFPNGPRSLINVGHLRAARRAREGGEANG